MAAAPSFPPLLKGHRIEAGKRPLSRARSNVAKGKAGAGDLFWSAETRVLDFVLVLEPEVSRARCTEMLYLAMVAFGDAAGALCPPEVSVTYSWPNRILMNEAAIGECSLMLSKEEEEGVPEWMLLSLYVEMAPEHGNTDPGMTPNQTTMWDEGCGSVSRTELLESVSRHLLSWIHTWSEDGFKSVHENWTGRVSSKTPLDRCALTDEELQYVGIDENGNALIKKNGSILTANTLEVIEKNQTAQT